MRCRPITRATAERLLAGVIDRAKRFNADESHLIDITELVVFGSYLDPGVQRLGDLDLGVAFRSRIPGTTAPADQREVLLRLRQGQRAPFQQPARRTVLAGQGGVDDSAQSLCGHQPHRRERTDSDRPMGGRLQLRRYLSRSQPHRAQTVQRPKWRRSALYTLSRVLMVITRTSSTPSST